MKKRKYFISFLFLISVIIMIFTPHRYGYSMHKTIANKYFRKYISLIDETKDVYMVGCINEYEYMYLETTDNKIYCGEKRFDSDEYKLYSSEYLYVYSNGVFEVRSGNYEVKQNEIFIELNKKKDEISNSSEYRAYRVTWNNGLPLFAVEGDLLLDLKPNVIEDFHYVVFNSDNSMSVVYNWNENDSFLFILNWSQVCDRGPKTEWISILDNIIKM